MKPKIALYGFINAKLKTRVSLFLSGETKDAMIRSKSLIEAFLPLRSTAFEGLEKIYSSTGDLKMVEAELFAAEMRSYTELFRLCSDPVLAFVKALSRGAETEVIKALLRLWFDAHVRGRAVDERVSYCYRGDLLERLSADAVLNAGSADELVSVFSDTAYAAAVRDFLPKAVKVGSVFELETAIDKAYYALLHEACDTLDAEDRKIAEKFIALDVDIQNISSLVRLSSFNKVPSTDLRGYLVDFPSAVSSASLISAYGSENVAGAAVALLGRRYEALSSFWDRGDISTKLSGLERLLREMRTHEAERLLGGNPFSIGIVIAYFILKADELSDIRTILNARYYELPEDRIRSIV